MEVVKRDGTREPVSFDKISIRIQRLAEHLEYVEPLLVAQKVIAGVYNGIETSQLDMLAAETAAYMATTHPNYEVLAGRIAISNLQKQTKPDFVEVIRDLHAYVNPKNGKHSPLISTEVYDIVQKHADLINGQIDYSRDFSYSFFGFKTLVRSYLLLIDGRVAERPQHMLMRVSIGIHKDNLTEAFQTYDLMSRLVFTHASPTMFNAGTPRPQCSSCFLLTMTEDSIEGIYETLTRCAQISRCAGGIGVSMHNIRAAGSYIGGTNGTSNGLTPLLRVYNATARYVDQGGGKRKGAFAIYLEPWHADIFDVLDMKKNTGPDELRARDLFYALWINDLFMQRVEANQQWSLMCPDECPGLADCHGEEFKRLYEGYESAGKARRTIPAAQLWQAILETQIETGTPYMLYKDACNAKSNQQHLGTIKGSNLCTEIIEYTSPDEVAVCNLASVSLKAFVVDDNTYDVDSLTTDSLNTSLPGFAGKTSVITKKFDHTRLFQVICQMTRNLNQVIDINYYPLEAARKSNIRHRPIGLGVQGLQDVFFELRLPFDGPEAAQLNAEIFETIYFAACSESNQLAKQYGPYETFTGSPASRGILQFDMWNKKPQSGRWDWDTLKKSIIAHGLRNSLLVAPMPTASTSQILGNTECFEPISSNIYSRSTLSGSFAVVNRYLVEDLQREGLWNSRMKNAIVSAGGSIQHITEISPELKALYKTVWEIKQRVIVDMAVARGAYIDQSQSLNIHMAAPSFAKLTALHFYTWKQGLKTGMYYLRTQPAANAIQFTVEKTATISADLEDGGVCTMEEGCLTCGS